MKKIILFTVLLIMTACSGPNNMSTCIPSRGPQDEKALDGSPIANMEQLDQKLEDAKIISTIVDTIKQKVVGTSSFSGAQSLFVAIVSSDLVQVGVSAMFTLYVIVTGILVIGGMINVTVGEMVIRAAKVVFVAYFALNWATFYDLIGQASLGFTDEMLGYFLDTFSSRFSVGGVSVNIREDLFLNLDLFIARIFSAKMMATLSALLFSSGPSGTIYAVMMGLAIFFVFKAIINVVLVYCFSLFARAMLFAVAPIFLAFILFQPTKSLFDQWLKQLVNYSLQPVLVGAFLGFFLAVIDPFFQEFLKYEVCWDKTSAAQDKYAWQFMEPGTDKAIDFGPNSRPAIEIQHILLFLGFGFVFYSATKLGEGMASGLAGTVAGNLSAAAQNLGGLQKFAGKNSKLGAAMSQI